MFRNTHSRSSRPGPCAHQPGGATSLNVEQEVLQKKRLALGCGKRRPCQRRPLHSSNGLHRGCLNPRFIRSKQADGMSRLKCHHHFVWHRRIGLSLSQHRAGQTERNQRGRRLVEAEAPMEMYEQRSPWIQPHAQTRDLPLDRLASAVNHEHQTGKYQPLRLDPARDDGAHVTSRLASPARNGASGWQAHLETEPWRGRVVELQTFVSAERGIEKHCLKTRHIKPFPGELASSNSKIHFEASSAK